MILFLRFIKIISSFLGASKQGSNCWGVFVSVVRSIPYHPFEVNLQNNKNGKYLNLIRALVLVGCGGDKSSGGVAGKDRRILGMMMEKFQRNEKGVVLIRTDCFQAPFRVNENIPIIPPPPYLLIQHTPTTRIRALSGKPNCKSSKSRNRLNERIISKMSHFITLNLNESFNFSYYYIFLLNNSKYFNYF